MNARRIISESGQSLVIIALGLIAFVAILALVLDGANAYAAKRQAQNAADAGALAGANILCKNLDEAGAKITAEEYVELNGGFANPDTDIVAELHLPYPTVSVTATVTKNTFFAGVIGFDQVSPVAVAEATCKNPGAGVLPVAWSCRASVGGDPSVPGSDCTQEINPDPEHQAYNLDYTYIFMDSVKVNKSNNDPGCNGNNPPDSCYESFGDIECAAPVLGACDTRVLTDTNKIDCDIDNDCINELKTGGSRAWLDLDNSQGGANQLREWISNPDSVPDVNVHDWLSSQPGDATSIFRVAESLVGTDVVLPVFNIMCDTGAPDIKYTLNADELKTGYEPVDNCTYTQLDNLEKVGSSENYHIFSFSAFHVTCVQTGSNHAEGESKDYPYVNGNCIGHEAASTNYYNCDPKHPGKPQFCDSSIAPNDKTIEGYFIALDLGGYSGSGAWNNTGTFTVVLTK